MTRLGQKMKKKSLAPERKKAWLRRRDSVQIFCPLFKTLSKKHQQIFVALLMAENNVFVCVFDEEKFL
jgi:hypothetical protein